MYVSFIIFKFIQYCRDKSKRKIVNYITFLTKHQVGSSYNLNLTAKILLVCLISKTVSIRQDDINS
jgi:hypothetical protein